MKIIKLTAENFKRLQTVEITPDGNVVMITGKNAQGKSSVLDAIMSVLCGKKVDPPKPIREGQDHAEVTVQTENWIIKRTWTVAGGGTLTVKNAEGFPASSPQKLLDKIVGQIAFDPLTFVNETSVNQKKTLMELVKLDLSDLEKKIDVQKQIRSDVKKLKEVAEMDLGRLGEVDLELPTVPVPVSDLTRKLNAAMEANSALMRKSSEIEIICQKEVGIKKDQTTLKQEIAALNKEILRLEKTWESHEDSIVTLFEQREVIQNEIKGCSVIDTTEIQTLIEGTDLRNASITKNNQRIELAKKVTGYRSEFAAAAKKISTIEAERTKRIAAVKMPIEGLSIDETGVLYQGIPMAQINDAAQLQVGVAISMALNPELRVIRLKGNDLDSDSLKMVADMVKEKDFQIWIEKIDESGEVGIVMEDGMVKESEATK